MERLNRALRLLVVRIGIGISRCVAQPWVDLMKSRGGHNYWAGGLSAWYVAMSDMSCASAKMVGMAFGKDTKLGLQHVILCSAVPASITYLA